MRRLPILIICLLSVGGCSSWWGDEEAPPLPGDRLSVLSHQQTITPDVNLSDAHILLPAPSRIPDWPQAGGYANHAMHHIAVADSLNRAWDADIGAGADDEERFVATPVVGGGLVFAMDTESSVSAFDPAGGDRKWEIDLTPDDEDEGHISGGIAYEDGRLFVTTGFAEVIALNAATGEVEWRQTVDSPLRAAPTVRGGRVFAITVDNKTYALAASSGRELWTHSGIVETANLLGGAAPAVDSGIVVAPYSSGELVAMRVETGRVLWSDSLTAVRRTDVVSSLAHIRGRPIIDRGRVIAISHGGAMAAIDLRSGQRLWERDIGGQESPWIAGDYVFVITNENELVCLSRNNGGVFWVTQLPRFEDEEDKQDPIVWTGPILVSDRLIVAGSEGEALAVSPYSGDILGKQDMPAGVSVPPIVADGTVYFLSDDAELVAYR